MNNSNDGIILPFSFSWRSERRRSPAKERTSPRILIVDDDLDIVTLLNKAFANFGCETMMSFDGETAISLMCSQPVDLIIIDWMMPTLSGGEALEEAQKILSQQQDRFIRNTPGEIPTIIFTGHNSQEIQLPNCQNFPLLDLWQKPMSFADLNRTISSTVQRLPLLY